MSASNVLPSAGTVYHSERIKAFFTALSVTSSSKIAFVITSLLDLNTVGFISGFPSLLSVLISFSLHCTKFLSAMSLMIVGSSLLISSSSSAKKDLLNAASLKSIFASSNVFFVFSVLAVRFQPSFAVL